MRQAKARRQLLGSPIAVHPGEFGQALKADVGVAIIKYQAGQFKSAVQPRNGLLGKETEG